MHAGEIGEGQGQPNWGGVAGGVGARPIGKGLAGRFRAVAFNAGLCADVASIYNTQYSRFLGDCISDDLQ